MKRVYIHHGAGRRETCHLLKGRQDGQLFGSNDPDRTVLAYYSDVLHVESVLLDEVDAAPSPEATAIEQAFDARPIEVTAAQPVIPREDESAGTEELPDPAFLLLAGLASHDVANYLLAGRAGAMRGPVRKAIRSAG